MHGMLAPRGNGPFCAIPLGEKLRKLNKKRQDEYDKKKRAAGKEPADKRAASYARVEAWHRGKLGEDCTAELAPFLPSPARCTAVQREEFKREEAPVKAEPAPFLPSRPWRRRSKIFTTQRRRRGTGRSACAPSAKQDGRRPNGSPRPSSTEASRSHRPGRAGPRRCTRRTCPPRSSNFAA